MKARHPQHQGLLQGISGLLRGTKFGTAQPIMLVGFGNFHHSPVKMHVDKNVCSQMFGRGATTLLDAAKKQSLQQEFLCKCL